MIWIWGPTSQTELNGVVRLIRRYRQYIALAVCVGNEGLLLERYSLSNLKKADETIRRQIRKKLSIPICTSESLQDFEKSGPQTFGDFLCPNIHPIFDRLDLAPREAAQWVREQALLLSLTTQKPVLVKETGFPHAGSAKFTFETQTQFWKAYFSESRLLIPDIASKEQVWVAFVSAFDQPWKAEQNGQLMEGSWGFWSTDRYPFPAIRTWQKPN